MSDRLNRVPSSPSIAITDVPHAATLRAHCTASSMSENTLQGHVALSNGPGISQPEEPK